MRLGKMTVGSLLLSVFLATVGTAKAQTQITLGSSSQEVTFTGMGASDPTQEAITLGQCAKGSCTMSGMASGSGALGSGPARYSLTSGLGSIVATLANAALGQWTISQTGPILFNYGPSGSLLKGDLNLLTFQEAPGSHAGSFNYEGMANLVVTGGSLAAVLGDAGIVDLTVAYTFKQFTSTGKNVMSLLGTTNSISGRLSGGELLPAPEPSAFLIFVLGSVLLLLGSAGKLFQGLRS
jgi:hypothetical protein